MDTHIVHFYEDDASLTKLLLEFIDAGLRAGDSCMILATRAHLDQISTQLRARGLGADAAVGCASGTFHAFDAAETLAKFMVEGWPDDKRFAEVISAMIEGAAAGASGRMHIFGEMTALLLEDESAQAAIRLEQLWNLLAATHSFSLVCSYPSRVLSVERHRATVRKICAEHSGVGLP